MKKEGADLFIVELAAILHDMGDRKFNNGVEKGGELTEKLLTEFNVDNTIIENICNIVQNLGFKGTGKQKFKNIEGKVVQDADRLDSLGALGIAKAFAYGGKNGRAIFDPSIKQNKIKNFDEYLKSTIPKNDHTIKHFYERLLLLKDLINTKTAKKIAEKRHKVMEEFLNEFYIEWD